MKAFSFFFLLLFSITFTKAQQADGCGYDHIPERELKKLPWYNNNSYLNIFLDSINNTDEIEQGKIKYRIPIKFWVYRNNDGITGGASITELKNFIVDINMYNAMNKTGFSYYMRPDIGYIKGKRHHVLGYYIESLVQTSIHKSPGCVNVFVVDNLTKKIPFMRKYHMRGSYNKITKAVIVKRKSSSTTLAHEVGHFFGLLHPHRNAWRGKHRQESVSRQRLNKKLFNKSLNCETNGDALCDTPAEPNLTGLVDKDCNYTGNKKDHWGDTYKPHTTNIMSYPTYRRCRNLFTKGQIAVMHYHAKKMDVKNWNIEEKRYNFDQYEPNNSQESATKLHAFLPQTHTFHKTYMGDDNPDDNNDTDWLKFQLRRDVKTQLTLTTEPGNFEFADTKIFLYDENLKLLASDDNGNRNNFSKIQLSKLNKGLYYVKIIKKNNCSEDAICDYKIMLTAKE